MRNASLSLAQTPPLSVPLRFFLTAPVFAALCGITLLLVGPEALSNRWHPTLLAATHFLTLGFLAMIMIGALQQLTPVLMGAPITQPVLISRLTHLLLTLGTLALAAGWLWNKSELFLLAGTLLGTTLTGFILVLLLTLRRARSDHATVHSSRIALWAFLVTVALGTYMVSGYVWSGLTRFPGITDLHMTWGMVGWTGLLIIAVAYQVVPMFQITPEYPAWVKHWLTWLILFVLVGWTVVLVKFDKISWLLNVFGILLATGLTVFLGVTLNLLSRRRRKIPDITLDFWRLAMGSLLLAIITWGISLAHTHNRLGLLFGVWMILGFAISAVSGMLYKIVPFLIWLHLNNLVIGQDRSKIKIPNMKQVIAAEHARWHLRGHMLTLLSSTLAVFWPEYFLRPAAVLLIVTAVILWKNLYSGLQLYRDFRRGNNIYVDKGGADTGGHRNT